MSTPHSRAEKKAWKEFSLMIRARDEVNGYFTCPTCGQVKPIEQADAGHCISSIKKAVKFDEMNVHAQCRKCNRFEEGNHTIYLKWLIEKYGIERVEDLQRRSKMSAGFKTADLLRMAKEYKERTKAIIERKKNDY